MLFSWFDSVAGIHEMQIAARKTSKWYSNFKNKSSTLNRKFEFFDYCHSSTEIAAKIDLFVNKKKSKKLVLSLHVWNFKQLLAL